MFATGIPTCASLLLAFSDVPLADAQQALLIDRIHAAWIDREQEISTFQYEWTYTMTLTAASAADAPDRRILESSAPRDFALRDMQARLIVDGHKVRYESSSISMIHGKEGLQQPAVSAFDGEQMQSFQPSAVVDYDQGVIGRAERFDEWVSAHLQPPVFSFRATLSPLPALTPENFRIVAVDAEFAGVPCLIIEERRGARTEALHDKLWLDARSYLTLRWESWVGERLWADAEVNYQADAVLGTIPQSWTTTMYSAPGGAVSMRYDAQIINYVLNEPVSEETFRIEFPAGTRVTDKNRGGGGGGIRGQPGR